MLETPLPQGYLAMPSLHNVGNVRVSNEFVAEPLNQRLAYSREPFGRFWFVEAKKIPIDFAEVSFDFSEDEAVFKTSSVGTCAPAETTVSAVDNAKTPMIVFAPGSYRSSTLVPYKLCEEDIAEFDVTYFENFPFDEVLETLITPLGSPQASLDRTRAELQAWLGASIDDLALLLDLSPTTLINLSKPGRSVRAKTVRKMAAVHGLLKELQRVVGTPAALTWARSSGRRLLADGDLAAFEQFVNTRIFPTKLLRPKGAAHFGDEDAELLVKQLPPAGKPARF